jgi:hypothetical protein
MAQPRMMRRFAAVVAKPLKSLVRQFAAAVCGGSEKPNEINVRRFYGGCVECTPIPL